MKFSKIWNVIEKNNPIVFMQNKWGKNLKRSTECGFELNIWFPTFLAIFYAQGLLDRILEALI